MSRTFIHNDFANGVRSRQHQHFDFCLWRKITVKVWRPLKNKRILAHRRNNFSTVKIIQFVFLNRRIQLWISWNFGLKNRASIIRYATCKKVVLFFYMLIELSLHKLITMYKYFCNINCRRNRGSSTASKC